MSWPGMGSFIERFVIELLQIKPMLPTYIHLITSAVFPIYVAAHASLRRPSSAAPAKKTKSDSSVDDENQDSTTPIESLTTSDALLFPILAGATLTGLYLIIQWLKDPALLNQILGYYFRWVGTFFMFKFLKDIFYIGRSFIFPSQLTFNGRLHNVNSAQNTFTVDENTQSNATGSLLSSQSSRNVFAISNAKLYWSVRRYVFTKINCSLATRQTFAASSSKFSLDMLDLAAVISSLALAILPTTLQKTPWYLTNLSGFSFCYGSLQFITPGTSATGSLLLSLLFCYDIYMVFYTPMMVTVATKLDVPIKLLIPRPADKGACTPPLVGLSESDVLKEIQKCLAKQRTMAMLGLGDIVIPGIMIAYALRFDLYNYYRTLKESEEKPTYIPVRGMWAERFYTAKAHWSSVLLAKSFPKPYFWATTVGYVGGMVTTVVVMQVFKHAQPALLYLVPGVLSTFWGLALFKGEVKLLWGYDEAIEEKEAEQKLKEKQEEEKEKKPSEGAAVDDTEKEQPKNQEFDASKPIFSFHVHLSTSSATSESKPSQSERVAPKSAIEAVAPSLDSAHEDGNSTASSVELISQEDMDTDSDTEGSEKSDRVNDDAAAFKP